MDDNSMKIIFDSLGSITSSDFADAVINQGSHNVNKIYVAFDAEEYQSNYLNYFATASFSYSNDQTADSIAMSAQSFDFNDKTYYGYVISLTKELTSVYGDVSITFRLKDSQENIIVATQPIVKYITKTDGNDPTINLSELQYNQLMNTINSKIDTINGVSTGLIANDAKIRGATFSNENNADDTAEFNFSSAKKVSVPEPTESTDAVTKNYVDTSSQNLNDKIDTKVDKSNGTLINPTIDGILKGNFTLENANPSSDNNPVTKKYVDDKITDVNAKITSSVSEVKSYTDTKVSEAKSYTDNLITQLIGGAPSAFDTLKEIADYISSDQSATSAMLASIQKNTQDILLKANADDVYTKEEVYDKSQIDIKLNAKAEASNVYSKTEVDSKLNDKANASNVYTKSEVSNFLSEKQDVLKDGQTIKTINGESILGSGNLVIEGVGGEGSGGTFVQGNPSGAPTEELNTITIGEKIYYVNNFNQTIDIDCDHEYEITGKTGHEYGVAIEDSQMLLKKIQGQTRRYSLNLCKLPDTAETTQNGITYSITDEIITLNGTATSDLEILYKIAPQTTSLKLNITYSARVITSGTNNFNTDNTQPRFIFSNNNDGYTGYISFNNTSINDTSTWNFTNGFGAVILHIRAGDSFTNAKWMPMIVEGTYTNETIPPFQSYDDTLVNSKANIISTGKNLLDESLFSKLNFDNSSNNEYMMTIWSNNSFGSFKGRVFHSTISNTSGTLSGSDVTITESGFYRVQIGNNISNVWIDNVYLPAGKLYAKADYKLVNDRMYYSNIYLGLDNSYENYKKDILNLGISLGAYDYIDNVSHLLVRQTSDVITYDGSEDENWNLYRTSKGLIFFGIEVSNSSDLSSLILNKNLQYKTTTELGNLTEYENCYSYENSVQQFRLMIDGVTSLEQLKSYLQSNPIQIAYKLATPTTGQISLPAGYAVYTGGLQQQVIDGKYLPYVLSKEYPISNNSQILANMQMNQSQQEQINQALSDIERVETDSQSKFSQIEESGDGNVVSSITNEGNIVKIEKNIKAAIASESASDIELSIDSSTYILTAKLKNKDGEVIGNTQTIDLPLETMVVGGSYNSSEKKVVLTLKNGQSVSFSVADLVDGLQSEITSANKLSADLLEDGTTNKVFTSTDETNISTLQSDMRTAKSDITTLKGNRDTIFSGAAKYNSITFTDWGLKLQNLKNDINIVSLNNIKDYVDGKIKNYFVHNILIDYTNTSAHANALLTLTIINSSSAKMSSENIRDYLINNGFTGTLYPYNCSGFVDEHQGTLLGLYITTNSTHTAYAYFGIDTTYSLGSWDSATITITDTVIAL